MAGILEEVARTSIFIVIYVVTCSLTGVDLRGDTFICIGIALAGIMSGLIKIQMALRDDDRSRL